MKTDRHVDQFLSAYSDEVRSCVLGLRKVILETLNGITEQVDIKAKLIGYLYGPKYAGLICVIIPSRKGVKLSFNRGVRLSNTYGNLEGEGKITRYIAIDISKPIQTAEISAILIEAQELYNQL